MLTYDELGSLFQRSFIGGSFKEMKYLGGNVSQFHGLKIDKASDSIDFATVVFNQVDLKGNCVTWVIDEGTNLTQMLKPASHQDYSTWKVLQNLAARGTISEQERVQMTEIENRRFQ